MAPEVRQFDCLAAGVSGRSDEDPRRELLRCGDCASASGRRRVQQQDRDERDAIEKGAFISPLSAI